INIPAGWASQANHQQVALTRDGTRLALVAANPIVLVWDGEHWQRLVGHTAWVMSVAFAPDDKLLATGSNDSTVKLWDVAGRNVVKNFAGHRGPIRSVRFSQDGALLASCSIDTTVKLWDVATREERETLKGHRSGVLSVAIAPDARTVLTGGEDK